MLSVRSWQMLPYNAFISVGVQIKAILQPGLYPVEEKNTPSVYSKHVFDFKHLCGCCKCVETRIHEWEGLKAFCIVFHGRKYVFCPTKKKGFHLIVSLLLPQVPCMFLKND